ncbi:MULTISPECIES: MDR family MFS transporter [unclassified Streptomyces]|uniref:MDR family MFS transporter n=1 Tax=unclassified Streptomyces TaxID=2593676 RepID=UPI00224D9E5D|nr:MULTISPECIES: MDR family MFS transporter [unclassified Streptomyces]MCX5140382.1 DHA2 family efflux MFS transporter permease subunit [Streptomyces sp. NBC_00338]WRZ64936.1 DHA2 family efflux MFS transporter permease subunit [Streptomyces sp. NBC_01257]WSU58935.1 DHA2 family efflux MFS transporter permease subunit [Streptomyces sp. NBC_01104]
MTQSTDGTHARQGPEAAGPPPGDEGGSGPSKLVLFALLLGLVLGLLDGTVVGTALPTIVGDLGGLDHLSWVVTVYLLTASVSTPIWGKLGDLYGRKGAFVWSVTVFLAGSVLSGLAQDMGQLIAFRAVQGLGAGGLMVGALSIIGVMMPPSQAGRSQAMIGAMMPVALVGGPLLGGFLTDQLNWRWVFYVNVPVGALALLVIGLRLHLHTERVKPRIDYAGAGLLTTAILALTLLGSWGGTRYGWSSPQIIGLGVTGAVALVWFVRVERRVAEPIIPPRLFADRNFTLAQILTFLAGAAMLGASTYLPQYMQFVRGASSTASGMLLLPLMAGMFGAQLLLGRILSKGGRYRPYPVLGGALTAVGALLLLATGAGTPTAVTSALTLVLGIGMGLLMQSTLLITINSATPRDMGAATGTATLVRTIGSSLGIAVLGAVYTSRLHTAGMPDGGTSWTPEAVRGMPDGVRDAVRTAVTDGLHGVLIGAALLGAVIFMVAWLMREVPLREE